MVPFDMTARRRANGLGEAQRGAQQLDLVEEQLRVAIRAEVGPALVAAGEDRRAHRVPRLLEPAHDLQVARDPEVPKLLLQALRDGHDPRPSGDGSPSWNRWRGREDLSTSSR